LDELDARGGGAGPNTACPLAQRVASPRRAHLRAHDGEIDLVLAAAATSSAVAPAESVMPLGGPARIPSAQRECGRSD